MLEALEEWSSLLDEGNGIDDSLIIPCVYINDIPDIALKYFIKIFADNVKLYPESTDGGHLVQGVVNPIENWLSQWQ